ncbi:hypothetical protein Bca4012_023562 [Brassica carinata]|uniref:Uncharacterized protein n=1 Tax=Brassica carinata TaxID=52824 RepID=A0A8X7NT63_BRACI|nr:hypothetical protein Bca52824_091498 [Brassica carinata]
MLIIFLFKPLYDILRRSSGDSNVRKWTEAGLPAKKAVLVFPHSSWAWTLAIANPNNNSYGADTMGPTIQKSGDNRDIQLKR